MANGRRSVPEGLDDRSQAIHCLECVQPKNRPVGNGMTYFPRLVRCPRSTNTRRPNHTAPYGPGHDLDRFQAMNCLVTIIRSLGTRQSAELCLVGRSVIYSNI